MRNADFLNDPIPPLSPGAPVALHCPKCHRAFGQPWPMGMFLATTDGDGEFHLAVSQSGRPSWDAETTICGLGVETFPNSAGIWGVELTEDDLLRIARPNRHPCRQCFARAWPVTVFWQANLRAQQMRVNTWQGLNGGADALVPD